MNKIDKSYLVRFENLLTLAELIKQYPLSTKIAKHIVDSRRRIKKILKGEDYRLLVIIGPCSVHDLNAVVDYAQRLKILREKYLDYLEIVMRTYFEKPRTVTGWKGLVYDPDLNGSYQVNHGLKLARKLLLLVNELGIPTATEFLNVNIVQFFADLTSWGTIGARTTESQIHREMASSLPCPVGFKNSTDGNIRVAIDAIRVSRIGHIFLSPDKQGQIFIHQTKGNLFGHIVMRGGKKPNYYKKDINKTCKILKKFDLPSRLIVDLSHGNCQGQYHRQLDVCDSVCQQISDGSNGIAGVMVESFLKGGTQNIDVNVNINKSIVYGQSITDPCLDWDESKLVIEKLAAVINSKT